MNKASAQKICPDFRPVPTDDGKVKCRFYNNGICKRPEYFRCELVLHKEREERKLINTPVVSVPRIETIMRCPRLYALTHVYRVDPPIPAKWKVVDKAFSDAMAKIDLGINYSIPEDLKADPIGRAKLTAVLKRYKQWKKDWGPLTTDVRVGFQYKDVYFLGYIDRLTKDKETIIRWKYAATHYDELRAIRIAALHFHAIPEAKKFVLAIAKRPQQRLKKATNETPYQLEERIYKELADKEHEQFMYWNYGREFFDIEGTLEQLYQSSKLIEAYERAGFPPAFGKNCENCDYRPYCLKHLTRIGCDENRCSYTKICSQISRLRASNKAMKELPANLENEYFSDEEAF